MTTRYGGLRGPFEGSYVERRGGDRLADDLPLVAHAAAGLNPGARVAFAAGEAYESPEREPRGPLFELGRQVFTPPR